MPRAKTAPIAPKEVTEKPVYTVESVMGDLLESVMDNKDLPEGVMLPVVNALKKVNDSIILPPDVFKQVKVDINYTIEFRSQNGDKCKDFIVVNKFIYTAYKHTDKYNSPTKKFNIICGLKEEIVDISVLHKKIEKLIRFNNSQYVRVIDHTDDTTYNYKFEEFMKDERSYDDSFCSVVDLEYDEQGFEYTLDDFHAFAPSRIMNAIEKIVMFDVRG